MASWILTMKATEEVRTSIIPLTQQDLNNDEVTLKVKEFDKKVIDKLKERAETLPTDQEAAMPTYKHCNDDDTTEEDTSSPDVDTIGHELYDRYISARVMLPSGDSMTKATVIGQKRDTQGPLICNTHPNPILDAGLYEVRFNDGKTAAYSTNIIAENIYEQVEVDNEGQNWAMMDEIVDHCKTNDVIRHEEQHFKKNGKKCAKWTTKEWFLCIKWKDGSTNWERVSELKESHPLETAEYAEANLLLQEPAFSWLVPQALRQKCRMVKVLKTRYHRMKEKLAIELPKNIK